MDPIKTEVFDSRTDSVEALRWAGFEKEQVQKAFTNMGRLANAMIKPDPLPKKLSWYKRLHDWVMGGKDERKKFEGL